MGLLNLGGPIAQFERNDSSISPVEVISLSDVRTPTLLAAVALVFSIGYEDGIAAVAPARRFLSSANMKLNIICRPINKEWKFQTMVGLSSSAITCLICAKTVIRETDVTAVAGKQRMFTGGEINDPDPLF